MPSYKPQIKSNDGSTTLWTQSFSGSDGATFTVTSTGVSITASGGGTATYTYAGTKTFIGLAETPNKTEPDYGVGTTFYVYGTKYLFYIVESSLADYRPLTCADAKIQVDSAIRDGNGARIDTNYAKKTELKTINGNSIIGSGDITIGGGGGGLRPYTSNDFSSVFEVANGTLTIKKSLYIVINYLSDTSTNYGPDYNTTIILPAGKTYTVGSVLPYIIKDTKMFYDLSARKSKAALFKLLYRNLEPRVYFAIWDIATEDSTTIYNAKDISTFTTSDSIMFLIEQ